VLDLSAAETAEALGTSPGGADVALSKARARLRDARPSERGVRADAVVAAFLGAVQLGLGAAALRTLAPDAVMLNDGGQRYHAGRMPIVGPKKIGTFLRRVQRGVAIERWRLVRCNGALAVLVERRVDARWDAPTYALLIEVQGGRIARLYTQLAGERLSGLGLRTAPA
jgi:RNA polymerase sigma-70 factor (ECF subfamily)